MPISKAKLIMVITGALIGAGLSAILQNYYSFFLNLSGGILLIIAGIIFYVLATR